ncbi:MAG: hypothetical protein GY940_35305, partial [bacterium]|nr:hypothetical protein [bacterium]
MIEQNQFSFSFPAAKTIEATENETIFDRAEAIFKEMHENFKTLPDIVTGAEFSITPDCSYMQPGKTLMESFWIDLSVTVETEAETVLIELTKEDGPKMDILLYLPNDAKKPV